MDSKNTSLTTAVEMLGRLSVSEIRDRIDEIDCERRALIVLLRAAMRNSDGTKKSQRRGVLEGVASE